ncbi:succinate--CoA ligase subunit alpha [Thermosphaera aggregans]|jgi:succinyl-CoA synthetase alpha subunit|uniref:Succinate--CoA ligase [ADP-forming] subunit alpha n=1 Tax=Thermosphaera aggregans (strain DSM 11486 / M11TL) TaxID=633148 RepID=D5U2D9_THEAM|nr:succinate--CoA ligase subunit alpha [Thermosphaera aggregans]ADG91289.1 succinyl-CoA synthetase (ADP-forming) alpha subunit [Thermosphaera aggregans DSM 11486]
MGILLSRNTRVIVQGVTGKEGSFHTKLMLEYGTRIVAGTSPGKKGQTVHGVPVYNTVGEIVRDHGEIDASIIFVPAKFAPDAVYEAIDNGVKLVVVITEGIPLHDELKFVNYARRKGVIIVGPNTPGLMTPGEAKLGIMPSHVFVPGGVGIVSRSGTLTYEVARELAKHGLGVSTVIGLGGDPVTGLDFIEVYDMFSNDPSTKAVVLIGEIGGDAEERFSKYYASLRVKKPVVAYIAGRTAPPGKRMGHAGAIISMGIGDYPSKRRALEEAGIPVAETPSQIPLLLGIR